MKLLVLLAAVAAVHCQDVCRLRMSAGMLCAGADSGRYLTQKYYYNATTNTCQSMVYAGCGGNANSFDSITACESRCRTGMNTGVSSTVSSSRATCPTNEVYDSCSAACQSTCNNTSPMCMTICTPGCVCAKGYIRSQAGGRCIPTYQCPQSAARPSNSSRTCGRNEVWDNCGTACPPTCAGTPAACTYNCMVGCRCVTGYVLKDGVCILPSQCGNTGAPAATANTAFVYCNSDSDCPSGQTCPQIFCIIAPCTYNRTCTPRMMIDPTPPLVGNSCASILCDRNSYCVMSSNGPRCQTFTVPVPNNTANSSPPLVGNSCASIFCDRSSFCVMSSNGPRCQAFTVPVPTNTANTRLPPGGTTCPANQQWDNCGSACPETCNGMPMICTMQCVVGCRCMNGYVLKNNACVLKSQC